MRILFVTHFSLPKHNAGTENYTLDLAKTLLAKAHEVEILCAEDWDHGDKYWNGVTHDVHDGISVHRIHLNWIKARNANKILYDSSLIESWLNQFLAVSDFDLVHVTSAYSLGIGVLRSVKRAGIPLVLTLMDFWFVCPSIQLLRSDGSLCDGGQLLGSVRPV
jgi:glycosyltransferase involved in cell wall biosynthesis